MVETNSHDDSCTRQNVTSVRIHMVKNMPHHQKLPTKKHYTNACRTANNRQPNGSKSSNIFRMHKKYTRLGDTMTYNIIRAASPDQTISNRPKPNTREVPKTAQSQPLRVNKAPLAVNLLLQEAQHARGRVPLHDRWSFVTKPKRFRDRAWEAEAERASSRKYTTSIMKTKAADYGHIKWIEDLVPRTMWIEEPKGYDKHALWGRRIIAVTELMIVEWHNYKHLDWITVRRDDDKLYKFKEGDFKRLRIQDIKDMLLLLVQGKLTNLTVEERFAFNVSLQIFTRSIVIQRRVEDLQLGVESYQKKLNLTKSDSYRSDLKYKEAYPAYSNPQGFIYQIKDKKNMLMRIDELHKFNDETLTDVCTALDDRLKGIRMQYLPQLIWKKSDKDRAAAMIQAIDKRLKTRRIMRSLERFVGGKLYEVDFRMLQRTI
nr:hypothetical protein [Tanacetum cinerariifolium]